MSSSNLTQPKIANHRTHMKSFQPNHNVHAPHIYSILETIMYKKNIHSERDLRTRIGNVQQCFLYLLFERSRPIFRIHHHNIHTHFPSRYRDRDLLTSFNDHRASMSKVRDQQSLRVTRHDSKWLRKLTSKPRSPSRHSQPIQIP